MQVNGGKIVEWINKELPPLSWTVISMQILKQLMQAGISPRSIDSSTMFNVEIVAEIKKIVSDKYKKDLPSFQ